MKQTGVTRRLDELGRVVIPKEIRKRLKINNGDMVDIFLEDDSIILQKYHPLNRDLLPIKAMLEAIKKEYNSELMLFDNSKVIYSTIDNNHCGMSINFDFIYRIENYLDKELSQNQMIPIVEGYKIDKDCIIHRIIVNFELYGYIVIFDDMLGKRHKEALDIIDHYFSHILNE